MKKVLALALGMLLIPFTAFGMQTMSEADMDSITGQSGVAISLSNVQIYSDGGDDLWYETTVEFGETEEESSQAVGILQGETASFTFINAIADPLEFYEAEVGSGLFNEEDFTDGNLMLRGDYTGFSTIFEAQEDGEAYGVRQNAAVLNIRVVDNANSVFAGKMDTGTTDDGASFAAIEIGLPTLEIYNPEGSVDVLNIVITGDYTDNPLADTGFDKTDENIHNYGIGTIYTGGESTTAILGGRVGITSYGQIGEDYKTYGFKDGVE